MIMSTAFDIFEALKCSVEIDSKGTKTWRDANGQLHREGGPAIEGPEGSVWYFHGQLHREGGPAIERANGDQTWWLHGQLHRENGPAIEWRSVDGRLEWWLHGQRHREGGPAVELEDGSCERWVRGKWIRPDK